MTISPATPVPHVRGSLARSPLYCLRDGDGAPYAAGAPCQIQEPA